MIDSEFLVFLVEDESLAHLWLVRRPRAALVPYACNCLSPSLQSPYHYGLVRLLLRGRRDPRGRPVMYVARIPIH